MLSKENIDTLLEKVDEVPLKKPIMNMTINEFGLIIQDEETFVLSFFKKRRLFKAIGLLKSYKRQMTEIANFVKQYDVKQTKEEQAAAIGINFPALYSRILITLVKFFNLKSFKEAGKKKVVDWMTIFQDEASSLKYQKTYSDIISQQQKQKKK